MLWSMVGYSGVGDKDGGRSGQIGFTFAHKLLCQPSFYAFLGTLEGTLVLRS